MTVLWIFNIVLSRAKKKRKIKFKFHLSIKLFIIEKRMYMFIPIHLYILSMEKRTHYRGNLIKINI